MSRHLLQKKKCQALRCLTHFLLSPSPSPPFSPISFLPLIYSKAALWVRIRVGVSGAAASCTRLQKAVQQNPKPAHWYTHSVLATRQPDLQQMKLENALLELKLYSVCVRMHVSCIKHCRYLSVSIKRRLCSTGGGSIINHSLAGNKLLLISNNKKQMVQQKLHSLDF